MLRQKDGIHFELSRTIVADARSATGDVNVVSHAHADHLCRNPDATVVCSAETAALAEVRTGKSVEYTEDADDISLLPAGHIVGSRAALIEDDGQRYLYTGDLSTRDRLTLSGFEPVDADVLVIETTYGHPDYRFPDQADLETEIVDWIADADGSLFLFGYSLGRAQEIQALADRATNRRIVVHDAVAEMNAVVERVTDQRFRGVPYEAVEGLTPEDVFVAPAHLARNGWVANLAARFEATKVGFSGWAVDTSYRYRGGYDETFVLSDHCDFHELRSVVDDVDPGRVYTHHGYDEAFADHVATEFGIEAQPLKRNQTSLAEFA
jgi:putative mRNA 3-end processing factor